MSQTDQGFNIWHASRQMSLRQAVSVYTAIMFMLSTLTTSLPAHAQEASQCQLQPAQCPFPPVTDVFIYQVGDGSFPNGTGEVILPGRRQITPNSEPEKFWYNWGYRVDQIFNGRRGHDGIDINGNGGGDTDRGDYIRAAADGVVIDSGYYPLCVASNNGVCTRYNHTRGWGHLIRIWHRIRTGQTTIDRYSLYAHMDERRVVVGQMVRRGNVIGLLGKTGLNLDGAHSHLGILKQNVQGNGYYSNGVPSSTHGNPITFLDQHRPYIFTSATGNPTTCSAEPVNTGSNIYACPAGTQTNTIQQGQTIWGLFGIYDVKVNHRFVVKTYKWEHDSVAGRNEWKFLWNWSWSNTTVEQNGGWNSAYFWPSFVNTSPGRYQFRFFVDVGAGIGNVLNDQHQQEKNSGADCIDGRHRTCVKGGGKPVASVEFTVEQRNSTSGGTLRLASASTRGDAGMASPVDAGSYTPRPRAQPAPPPQAQTGAITLRAGACHRTAVSISSSQRLQAGLTDVIGYLELRLQNGNHDRRTVLAGASLGGLVGNQPDAIEVDQPGIWQISVCATGGVDSSFTLVTRTIDPDVCTPSAWACSDWSPSACSPWSARTRNCTLRNRNCLQPQLVRPVEVESCPPPACSHGLIHLAGGNPAAVWSDVLYTDIQCPGAVGTFQRTTAPLPGPLVGLGLARVGSCLIIPGGVRPGVGSVAEVWLGRITAGGDVLAWNGDRPLPSPRGWHSVFTWQNQACVAGGHCRGQNLDDIVCAAVDTEQCRLATDWYSFSGSRFSGGRYTHVSAVLDDRLLLASGWTSRPRADVQLAGLRLVNQTIRVEAWTSQPELQTPRFEGAGACTGGWCFLAGGANDPGGNGDQTLGSVEVTGLTATGLNPWSAAASFSPARRALTAFTYHDRFCVAGGVTASGEYRADIQCAPIQANGRGSVQLGSFAPAGSLGAPRSSFGLAVGPVVGSALANAPAPPTTAGQTTRAAENPMPACAHGQIHVIGGGTDRVWFTNINCASGELSPWRETMPFPRRIAEHGAVRAGQFIVIVGGVVPGAASALRLATIGRIDPAGAVSAWLESDRLLPVTLRNHAVFYYRDHRQVCAVGSSSSGGTIYCTQFDEVSGTLGDWYQVSGPAYPGQREAAASALVGNRLWLFGGWGSGRPLSDAPATTLSQANGRLIINTSWTQPGQLIAPRFEGAVAGAEQAIYLAGGTDDGNGASALSDTTMVLLNLDGAIDRIITGPSFSPGRWELTLNRYGPYLYLIGGRTGAGRETALAEVLVSQIQANRYPGNWTPATALPLPVTGQATVVGPR